MLREWGFAILLAVGSATAPATPAPSAAELAALEQRVKDLEHGRDILFQLLGGTLLSTLVACGVTWLRLTRKAHALARQEVDRLVESYPGAVERLVKEHETEARLRRESSVAIVSDELDLQALLRHHGFRSLKTIRVSEATAATLEPFAAVVLDLDHGLTQGAAATLIAESPREHFLAYWTGVERVPLPAGRATFANSPVTLYARLMELFRFQAALEAK